MDLVSTINNPLIQSGRRGPFIRMMIAEAVGYGMPPQVAMSLDDIASMLGFYQPLSAGQAAHLAAPLVKWRTDRAQPVLDDVVDVSALARKQRALGAFGGAPPDHLVGTAEIVYAMGSTIMDATPDPFIDVFRWAAVDVMSTLTGQTPDEIRAAKSWPLITDDEVIKPGGRLHVTYQTMVDHIRRNSIAAMKGDPDSDPREVLRPLAQHFLNHHDHQRRRAEAIGDRDEIEELDRTVASIRRAYPGLEPQVKPTADAPAT